MVASRFIPHPPPPSTHLSTLALLIVFTLQICSSTVKFLRGSGCHNFLGDRYHCIWHFFWNHRVWGFSLLQCPFVCFFVYVFVSLCVCVFMCLCVGPLGITFYWRQIWTSRFSPQNIPWPLILSQIQNPLYFFCLCVFVYVGLGLSVLFNFFFIDRGWRLSVKKVPQPQYISNN